MPDWKQLVRERLSQLNLPPGAKEDVIAELAAHLEDSAVLDRQMSESENCALVQIHWHKLERAIERAKCKEDPMNHRTKTILLPAIAVLFTVGLVLLFLDRAALVQRLIWIACMALLLCVAASEANRLNLRTKSLWLPGFVSLLAASLWMFAEEIVLVHDPSFYFTDLSLRPSHLISGLPRWFYVTWLLAQVPCGAMGAFLSRRGGGTRTARILAGAFPALVMSLICCLVIPISAFFEHNTFVFSHPSRAVSAVLIWVGIPAVALLLGAAPFLSESTLQRA
jgi:hypothetical protein